MRNDGMLKFEFAARVGANASISNQTKFLDERGNVEALININS